MVRDVQVPVLRDVWLEVQDLLQSALPIRVYRVKLGPFWGTPVYKGAPEALRLLQGNPT